MTNLLMDEYPLVVLPKLAECVGLNQAIVLQQIHYWTSKNGIERDGFRWVYNTYPEWQSQFPFWSVRTVWAVINGLEKKKILVAANYNKMGADRTKWYRIDYEKLESTISQHLRDHVAEVARPIPETTTETTKTTTKVVGTTQDTSLETINPDEGEKTYGDPGINTLVSAFEQTFDLKLKRVKQQRFAAKRLINSYGLQNSLGAIRAAGEVRDAQYAPQILSLEDLWEKWDKLVSYYRKKQQEQGKTASKVKIIEE